MIGFGRLLPVGGGQLLLIAICYTMLRLRDTDNPSAVLAI